MVTLNLTFAWAWILMGLVSGTIAGLYFHQERWMGGYGSWRRRMMRLGHIAFFGTGLLNLAFALTMAHVGLSTWATCSISVLLIIGAITMPAVCYLAAWRKPWRGLFFVPVLSLVAGVGILVVALLMDAMPLKG